MSGITISTPRSSASGNIIPASIRIMSSPVRSTSMFIPNSPNPPRGIAKREGFVNAARNLVRDTSSYHKGPWDLREQSTSVVLIVWFRCDVYCSWVAGSPSKRGRAHEIDQSADLAHRNGTTVVGFLRWGGHWLL